MFCLCLINYICAVRRGNRWRRKEPKHMGQLYSCRWTLICESFYLYMSYGWAWEPSIWERREMMEVHGKKKKGVNKDEDGRWKKERKKGLNKEEGRWWKKERKECHCPIIYYRQCADKKWGKHEKETKKKEKPKMSFSPTPFDILHSKGLEMTYSSCVLLRHAFGL